MKPEAKVEIFLWDWLRTKGKYIKQIYLNRKNELNGVFNVKGTKGRKPDFVIEINRGFGKEYIAVEIKKATSSKSVLDSGKILDYYEDYFKEKAKYFINEEEIKISHFVIATQNSIRGYLFNNEKEILSNCESNDLWRKTNAKYRLEPKEEFKETSRFQRNLWNQFKRLREKNNIKESASIGIIMSKFYENTSPHLFIMNYNKHLKKPRWGARFLKI